MDTKYIYAIMLMEDCVYQPMILGIMDSEERAKEMLSRIMKKTDPYELSHVDLYIEEHILNDIGEDVLMYNNLRI